jgi:hypothetical protein
MNSQLWVQSMHETGRTSKKECLFNTVNGRVSTMHVFYRQQSYRGLRTSILCAQLASPTWTVTLIGTLSEQVESSVNSTQQKFSAPTIITPAYFYVNRLPSALLLTVDIRLLSTGIHM